VSTGPSLTVQSPFDTLSARGQGFPSRSKVVTVYDHGLVHCTVIVSARLLSQSTRNWVVYQQQK
jgi:hypothetical protein